MKSMRLATVVLLLGIGVALVPNTTSGQLAPGPSTESFSGSAGRGTLSLDATPETPAPNETVSFELTSYSTDLTRANISWLVNGVREAQGTGLRSFETSVGESGSVTRVAAVIITNDGNRIRAEKTIRPVSIDLVWEADTYTPPFYKGKPRYTHESSVRVVALPHFTTSSGSRLDPSNLFYQWRVEGKIQKSLSGQGKQAITIPSRRISRPITVSVQVSSLNETYSSEKALRLESSNPEVVVYAEHPILGTMYQEAATKGYVLSNKEATFRAIPYFFSIESIGSGDIMYDWFLNENSVTATGNRVTFRNENSRSGEARVSIKAEHRDRLMQVSGGTFPLTFGS